MGLGNDLDIDLKEKMDLEEPKMSKVYLLNDNYSTFDFVVFILTKVFNKSRENAVELTLLIHNEGKALVGEYTRDIALTKQFYVSNMAKAEGFPLKAEVQ